MGMIVRVAFNNNGWIGKCDAAKADPRLFKCKKRVVRTGYKVKKDGGCAGRGCLEKNLLRGFRWESWSGDFGERARGRAYFVFVDTDGSLVLWGRTRVAQVSSNAIRFTRFRPLPESKWVRGLSYRKLLGRKWGQGPYRYIDSRTEARLDELIQASRREPPDGPPIAVTEGEKVLLKELVRERSSWLVAQFKKQLAQKKCWVCGFDFAETYGPLASGYIEAHHTLPLSGSSGVRRTKLTQLVAVCSNCHRVLHRRNPPYDWRKLRAELA